MDINYLLTCFLNGFFVIIGFLAVVSVFGILFVLTVAWIESWFLFNRVFSIVISMLIYTIIISISIIVGCNLQDTCPYWFCI